MLNEQSMSHDAYNERPKHGPSGESALDFVGHSPSRAVKERTIWNRQNRTAAPQKKPLIKTRLRSLSRSIASSIFFVTLACFSCSPAIKITLPNSGSGALRDSLNSYSMRPLGDGLCRSNGRRKIQFTVQICKMPHLTSITQDTPTFFHISPSLTPPIPPLSLL